MNVSSPQIVVAGHLCLDIIPDYSKAPNGADMLPSPGGLLEVGEAVMAAGGVVANTGLTLHRLGVLARLVGKVGDDLFGSALLDLLCPGDTLLTDGMVVIPGEHTSYTLVINPPGVDRAFLHCPGANDTFCAGDVPDEALRGARLFHFGYPPLMRRMYMDDGAEMAALFERVKARGLLTSLDMAWPDPSSEAGQVDWRGWLERVLPHVDLFGPSLEEILFMLKHSDEEAAVVHEDLSLLSEVAGELIGLGTAAVVLKLGDQGLYLRTSPNLDRLPGAWPAGWASRELWAPCFEVEVAGTTGAGDCTLGGLLAGVLEGGSPEEALTVATAVGAFSVEHEDRTDGVPSLEAVRERVVSGWTRCPLERSLEGWHYDAQHGLWQGPNDHSLLLERTLR